MRVPTVVKNLLAGRHKIDPRDLLPRRSPQVKHRLVAPTIPPHRASFYSACLHRLGHDPTDYNLPPFTPGVPGVSTDTTTTSNGWEIGYESPAARRVQKGLAKRVAKINFVKAQMAKMPQIIEQWREERRAGKAAKQKKYPF